jgi:hypothetical protein
MNPFFKIAASAYGLLAMTKPISTKMKCTQKHWGFFVDFEGF